MACLIDFRSVKMRNDGITHFPKRTGQACRRGVACSNAARGDSCHMH